MLSWCTLLYKTTNKRKMYLLENVLCGGAINLIRQIVKKTSTLVAYSLSAWAHFVRTTNKFHGSFVIADIFFNGETRLSLILYAIISYSMQNVLTIDVSVRWYDTQNTLINIWIDFGFEIFQQKNQTNQTWMHYMKQCNPQKRLGQKVCIILDLHLQRLRQQDRFT